MRQRSFSHYFGLAFLIAFIGTGFGANTNLLPIRPQSALTPTALPSTAGWAKTYGNSTGNELAVSIAASADGGSVLAGYSILQSSVEGRVWKLDAAGNLVWQKAYTGSSQEPLNSIIATTDGGYLAVGNTNFGAGQTDAWVVKLDSAGNIVWQKAIGGADSDGAISVVPASDGGFVIIGLTEIIAQGHISNWVIKLDAQGNLLWQKVYGETNYPTLRAITPAPDGGYLIAGATPTSGTSPCACISDGWLLKLDNNGNTQWQKSYGGTDYDTFTSVIQTSDGGYLAAGQTNSFGAGMEDAWLVKVDSAGNIVWQKTYGGSNLELLNAIANAGNGSYVITGATRSFGSGGIDGWIMKVDNAGTPLWQNAYGGTAEDSLSTIRALSDGSFLAAGTTDSFGTGNGDEWLLNVDANGKLPSPCSFGVSFTAAPANSNGTGQNSSFATSSANLSSNSTSATAADSHDLATTQCQGTKALQVQIDIQPESKVNSINLKSNAAIPVAILSSASFDATKVDPKTVCFGNAEDASQRACAQAQRPSHIRDVNHDGRADLLLRFATRQTGIDSGDTQACLTGKTRDATAIEGCDTIRTK